MSVVVGRAGILQAVGLIINKHVHGARACAWPASVSGTGLSDLAARRPACTLTGILNNSMQTLAASRHTCRPCHDV